MPKSTKKGKNENGYSVDHHLAPSVFQKIGAKTQARGIVLFVAFAPARSAWRVAPYVCTNVLLRMTSTYQPAHWTLEDGRQL